MGISVMRKKAGKLDNNHAARLKRWQSKSPALNLPIYPLLSAHGGEANIGSTTKVVKVGLPNS
jgi:hypothetical protein